jgi:hypothetical protein
MIWDTNPSAYSALQCGLFIYFYNNKIKKNENGRTYRIYVGNKKLINILC